MRRTIVIAGSLAQRPGNGGHAWVFLQYLLGFKRLGWDVLFLDRLDASMCIDSRGQACKFEVSKNKRYFLDVMQRFGLNDSYSLDYNRGELVLGLPRANMLERVRHAATLINVMGFIDDHEVLSLRRPKTFWIFVYENSSSLQSP